MSRGLWPWIAVLFGLVFAGWTTRYFDVDTTFICAMELAREDRRAADVLLVGNSRLGTAVDVVYLERLLRERTGQVDISVERLTPLGSKPSQFHAIVREYVRNRGAPRLVLIAVPHTLEPDAVFQGAPLFMERTVLFSSMHTLGAVQAGFLKGDPMLLPVRISLKDWQSVPRLFLFRATESVYAILKALPRHVSGEILTCPAERKGSLAGRRVWPYGILGSDVDPASLDGMITLSPMRAVMAREQSDRIGEVDPEDPRRHLEMDQLRQMSAYLMRRGTRVILTVIPLYMRTDLEEGRAQKYEAQVPGARFLDSYGAIDGVTDDVRAGLFRDAKHMNFRGAQLETVFLADELAGYLQ